MGRYIVRRMLINIPVLWLIVTLVFFATSVLPGDFVAQRHRRLQPARRPEPGRTDRDGQETAGHQPADRPALVTYLWDNIDGDLRNSYRTRQSAFGQFRDALPYTLQLSVIQLIIGLLIACRLASYPRSNRTP